MAKVVVCPDCGSKIRLFMDGDNLVAERVPEDRPKKSENDLIDELVGSKDEVSDGPEKK